MKVVAAWLALAAPAIAVLYLLAPRQAPADPPPQCCAQAVPTAAWYAWNQLDCDDDQENGIPCVDNMEFVQVAPQITSVTRVGDRVVVPVTVRSSENVSYDFTVTTSAAGEFVAASP